MPVIQKKRRPFTIIELLSVVAVIAILISLLLPILISAQKTAKKIACAGNMRQCATAVNLYAGDWGGILPPARNPDGKRWGGGDPNPNTECGPVAHYFNSRKCETLTNTSGIIKYRLSLIDCPDAPPVFYSSEYVSLHYPIAYNGARAPGVGNGQQGLGDYKWADDPAKDFFRQIAMLETPSKIIMFTDSFGSDRAYNPECQPWSSKRYHQYNDTGVSTHAERSNIATNILGGILFHKVAATRHKNTANIAFVDGHVGSTNNLERDSHNKELTVKTRVSESTCW